MKDTSARILFLTILLTTFPVMPAGAQQSATSQPAPSKPSAPASTAPAAATSSGKVVLKVGTTRLTESDVDFLVDRLGTRAKVIVAKEGLRPVGEEYVKMILLSRRATEEHVDSSPEVRSQLEFLREQVLADAEYRKMSSEVKASPEEVRQYFTAHRFEFETVQVREFLIRKRPQGVQDPKQGLPVEEAKAKAEAVRKELLAGKDVDQVASDFAIPANTVMLIDRKPRSLRRTEMQPALSKAAFNAKDGGVTEPVDTPQAFIVVKVFGHQYPELKDVSAEIETRVRQQKLDAQITAMEKTAGVWMDEDYFSRKPSASPAAKNQPSGN